MILEHHEDGMNQKTVIEVIQDNEDDAPGRSTLRNLLDDLVNDGTLETQTGPSNATEYFRCD